MNLLVASRLEIEERIEICTPYVVISISDLDSRRPRLTRPAAFRDALFLQFYDAQPVRSGYLPEHTGLMTEEHAKAIWAFVESHRHQVETIVVHCEQGISRSPAVAAAICRKLGLDDTEFLNEYQPNQYVYNLLLRTMGVVGQ